MKNIFKFLISIFVLAITLLIGSNTLHNEKLKSDIQIDNIKKESVLLISNNRSSSKITLRKKNNFSNLLASTPVIISNFSYNIIFDYTNSQFNWEFIYYLKNSIKKSLYIRAP